MKKEKRFIVETRIAGNMRDTYKRKAFDDESKAKNYMIKKVRFYITETMLDNNMSDAEVEQYIKEIGFSIEELPSIVSDIEGEWSVQLYDLENTDQLFRVVFMYKDDDVENIKEYDDETEARKSFTSMLHDKEDYNYVVLDKVTTNYNDHEEILVIEAWYSEK